MTETSAESSRAQTCPCNTE
jgi:hypothetical protein